MSNKKRIFAKIKQLEKAALISKKIKFVNKIYVFGNQLHLAKLNAQKKKSLLFRQ